MNRFTVYAPVIIPTLCRFDHFKRCIDSLGRCTGSDKTEVFIGLDYPTKESHWEGYNQICEYIPHISSLFKCIHLIKRDQNLGPSPNIRDLVSRVKQKFDRFILSEDDNEFSPNFLEYMNSGLEKFYDNPNVLRICGCLMPWNVDFDACMSSYPYNAFPAMDYSAWGVGFWTHKLIQNPLTKDSVLKSPLLTFKAIRYGYCTAISRFLHHLNNRSQLSDICFRLYCGFNHYYCIFPRISKVKNHGLDGSGNVSDSYTDPQFWIDKMELDTSRSFEFDSFNVEDYPEVKKYLKFKYDESPNSSPHLRMKVWLSYLFYRITGARRKDVPYGQSKTVFMLKSIFHIK